MQTSTAPPSYAQAAKFERRPFSSHSHSHISSFRSLLLDMQIYSSSIKAMKHPRLETTFSYPVFSDQDKIEGKVLLDPSCSKSGRLTISLEGAFEYPSIDLDDDKSTVRRRRHVFLSLSTFALIPSPSESRSAIREALSVRKKPSASSPAPRSCEFSFGLPRGSRVGEEMPSTFSNKTPTGNLHGQAPTEEFEVAYYVKAVWEASDGTENRAILEVPVLFQAETDFQCVDCSAEMAEPGSWLEMSLIPDRPIPFSCAITFPHFQSFSRCSSIPYFVVFSTSTRSPSLIREIATDATIAVSLIRKITITPQRTMYSPTLPDSAPVGDESDGQGPASTSRSRLLKKSLKTLTRSQESIRVNKPLPQVPQEPFSSSRILQTQVAIGFPKRPRTNAAPDDLPDGLCKSKMQLSKDMLPSVAWPGISVKYYLDVSVLVGQDDVRACFPIWIY